MADARAAADLTEIVELVTRIVAESGEPAGFDAAAWTARWVDSPVPALGGQRPREVMTTGEGRELVLQLLHSMQSGAFW